MATEERPELFEIRLHDYPELAQALGVQEPVARLLCPEPEHPGPCEVPWGLTLEEDGPAGAGTHTVVLGVCATAARAEEIAARVRTVAGGHQVTVRRGDGDGFAELWEQYRVERAARRD